MKSALAAIVVFAAFGLSRQALTWLSAAIRVRDAQTSHEAARQLFLRGVLPTMLSAFVAAFLIAPAFLLLEPPDAHERPGVILLIVALAGIAQLAVIAARAVRLLSQARRVTRLWSALVTPERCAGRDWEVSTAVCETGAPIVAAAGLFRPRIFVDASVLQMCAPSELRVVAAHELAHVRRYDNLQRLLIAACCGTTSALAVAWRQAAECAADDAAAPTVERSLDLASALVKIARCQMPPALDLAAVSSIADGLDARVRRLVADDRIVAAAPARTLGTLQTLAMAGLIVAATGLTLVPLHELIELTVNRLP